MSAKLGKAGRKGKLKSKPQAGKAGKAQATAAAVTASAPLYLHLEVQAATNALCYQQPDGNVVSDTAHDKRTAR